MRRDAAPGRGTNGGDDGGGGGGRSIRRRWRRTVGHPAFPLVAEGFLSRLSFGIISLALPLYAYRLGMSVAEIGVLLSLNMVVALLLKPLMGAVADKVGLKRSLVAAIAMRSVVSLLFVFAAAPWQLFAIRGLHGVSIALRDPSTYALVAEAGGKRQIASSFAWYQTAKTLAGSDRPRGRRGRAHPGRRVRSGVRRRLRPVRPAPAHRRDQGAGAGRGAAARRRRRRAYRAPSVTGGPQRPPLPQAEARQARRKDAGPAPHRREAPAACRSPRSRPSGS